jgi:hypothetical protein
MSVEPEPRVEELRGAEAMLVHHKWGTNGIVLELEVALATAVPWLEMIATFEDFGAAFDCCHVLNGQSPGIVKKEIALLADPIPGYFTALAEHLPAGRHAVILIVAESSRDGRARPAWLPMAGPITYRQDSAEVAATHRTLLEYCWNHTTLQALKVDKTLTYIQSRFDPPAPARAGAGAAREAHARGDDARGVHPPDQTARTTCSGLQIVRYTDDARLRADHADLPRPRRATINNPHTHILEDGASCATWTVRRCRPLSAWPAMPPWR